VNSAPLPRHRFRNPDGFISFEPKSNDVIPLEDSFADVIGKAQRGLRLSDTELAEKARVSSQQLRSLRAGEYNELALLRVAPSLGLAARALSDLATGNWRPREIQPPPGLAYFNSRFHDMTVNSYLVWDPATKQSAAIDTGADCDEMLDFAGKQGLKIELILLTHAHSDHIADLGRLRSETGARVFAPANEMVTGAEPIEEGEHFELGRLDIEARLTFGHSPGGLTFVVSGLEHPIALVGDSIFAGSMGGGNISYDHALENNLKKILILPNDTIICPGHGPLTTVGEEKQHNPFFAGRV
jgi:glyoxylase-like metal-dependent hydrolase (beta-lactamase superfamily II)